MSDVETRSLTSAEAQTGVQLKAGHRVILIISDGKGTAAPPQPPDRPAGDPGLPGEHGEADDTRRTFAEATILDEDGKPLAGAPWKITFSDGSTKQGHTETDGSIAAEGPPGAFLLILPEAEA
jgi:hypothetical protein